MYLAIAFAHLCVKLALICLLDIWAMESTLLCTSPMHCGIRFPEENSSPILKGTNAIMKLLCLCQMARESCQDCVPSPAQGRPFLACLPWATKSSTLPLQATALPRPKRCFRMAMCQYLDMDASTLHLPYKLCFCISYSVTRALRDPILGSAFYMPLHTLMLRAFQFLCCAFCVASPFPKV